MKDKERRELIRIKGANSSEKFSCIEKILKRMAKRMGQKIVGIMPPSVIFQYVKKADSDGTIFKCFIPSGKITKICLAIKKYNVKENVRFICDLQTGSFRGQQYAFETHDSLFVEDLNISVNDISFFTLKVDESGINNPELDPPIVEDIWVTALFHFNRTEDHIKMFVREELEKLEELDEGI